MPILVLMKNRTTSVPAPPAFPPECLEPSVTGVVDTALGKLIWQLGQRKTAWLCYLGMRFIHLLIQYFLSTTVSGRDTEDTVVKTESPWEFMNKRGDRKRKHAR